MKAEREISPAEAAQELRRRWKGKRKPSTGDVVRSLQRGFEKVEERIERERRLREAWRYHHPKGDIVVRI